MKKSVEIRDKSNSLFCSSQSRWSEFGCYPLEEVSSKLEFSITLSSNDLVPELKYSKKQELLYQLIRFLHEEKVLGYRKISYKLNSWGIKTPRGNQWLPQSVHSVLKRKSQRDNRIEKQRNQRYPIEIGELSIKYLPID